MTMDVPSDRFSSLARRDSDSIRSMFFSSDFRQLSLLLRGESSIDLPLRYRPLSRPLFSGLHGSMRTPNFMQNGASSFST